MLFKWDTIHNIYQSFLGKILLLLSVLSIIFSVINFSKIYLPVSTITLLCLSLSVLFFLIGYLLYTIFIPDVIKQFKRYEYLDYSLNRHKEAQFSNLTEFNFITKSENFKILKNLPIYNSKIDNLPEPKDLDTSKDSIYLKIQIKYDYINNEKVICRFFISCFFYLFLFLFYYPSISNLINFILGEYVNVANN